MKPQRYLRYLESGSVGPAKEAEVRRFAIALIEKHGIAGVAELVAEGRLDQEFPFTVDLPKYDPKKARLKPTPAIALNRPDRSAKDSIYETASALALSKFEHTLRMAPVVELTGAKIYAVGRRWMVVDIDGEKTVLKLSGNSSLLESALGGSNAHKKILSPSKRKRMKKSLTKPPAK
jgi:hypothetical protein